MATKSDKVKSDLAQFKPRNILDSTAPRPRGKERLIPKQKKPKTFKKRLIEEKKEVLVQLATKINHNEKDGNGEDQISVQSDQVAAIQIVSDINKAPFEEYSDNHETKELPEDSLVNQVEKLKLVDVNDVADAILHCSKYREYVNQAVTNEIEYTTYEVLLNLIRFQDRVYKKDPEKFIKRRFVCGFNEVIKCIHLDKAKAVIVATDIERIKQDGLLDQRVNDLTKSANERQIPIIFTSTRNRLATVCSKRSRSFLSCLALIDYGGTQDEFHKLIDLVNQACQIYEENRAKLIKHLSALPSSSLQAISKDICENGQIPGDYVIYKETVYSPLQQNIHRYIKALKKQKNSN